MPKLVLYTSFVHAIAIKYEPNADVLNLFSDMHNHAFTNNRKMLMYAFTSGEF